MINKEYKILCADCTDSNLFKSSFIDLTVTSPPYNLDMGYNSNDDNLHYQDYLIFTEKYLKNIYNWTNSDGRLCLNIPIDNNKNGRNPLSYNVINIALSIGWKYNTTIVWHKRNVGNRLAWGSFSSASSPIVASPVELIIVLYKGTWKKLHKQTDDINSNEFIKWTNGMWEFNGESAKRLGHPAPYPVELPYRCIKLFSYQEETIFDPFLGSGTTLVACKQLFRNGIGIELDKQYYKMAIDRVQQILL